ncbi:thioesterase II family protein [Micromonospora inyonensis]|uniref:Pyochelin biosynthetic protein PchC n=1 Tax=Micromonospora inyonensis TaxID=47866 RepID=A0A1C6S6Z3_9ACTN|nr:alpha/beta fold hydrolase [Micromonospora inyonensis]SCL25261.1 pyochelin biosynthetic protein PchC [Micromonospora inyonensis]
MALRDDSTRWFRRYVHKPEATGRLVCFTPAGSMPSFYLDWARTAPPSVEVLVVTLPGREERSAEPPVTDLGSLADAVAQALGGLGDRPTVLFGHSMGAAVAYEVSRRYEASGGALAGLVVSACASPARQPDSRPGLTAYDDDQLATYLRTLGGTSNQVFDDPEVRQFVLDTFRADLAVLEPYRPDATRARLRTPVQVFRGDQDPATPADDAARWAEVTDRFAGVRSFPGGHFYLLDQRSAVLHAAIEPLPGGVVPSASIHAQREG